jgi:hypothetical protein
MGVFDTVTLGWVAGVHTSFHYITDKNKRLTTRGITIHIVKIDNMSPAKFRVGGQYFVPVGRGVGLGTPEMTNIFHKQNQLLRTTKMKLVHNLGEMEGLLDIELNEHIDIPHGYRMSDWYWQLS